MASIEQSVVKIIPFDMAGITESSPLWPIVQTGGLVAHYSPTISENITVNYSTSGEIVHSNESFNVYKSTENRRIEIGEMTFTADTTENARYVLAVIHFFRSYSLMDQGRGRTGKPPSPMWISAYGPGAFDRVPALLSSGSLNWPNNVDYVAVTNSPSKTSLKETPRGSNGVPVPLSRPETQLSGDVTWVPIKMTVSMSFIVQHSPKYWLGFNLTDFKNGRMLSKRETTGILKGAPVTTQENKNLAGGRDQSGKTTEPVKTEKPTQPTTNSIPIFHVEQLNQRMPILE